MNHSIQEQIIIDEASNGREAVEIYKSLFKKKCHNENCPHPIYKLIIMDLQMPIMDGFEASEIIFKMMSDSPDMYPNV